MSDRCQVVIRELKQRVMELEQAVMIYDPVHVAGGHRPRTGPKDELGRETEVCICGARRLPLNGSKWQS